MPRIENQREAIEILIRNGIDVDDDARVILYSPRNTGLKLLKALDYLMNRCQFNRLGQVATESFLKAKRIHDKSVSKAYKGANK